MRYGLMDAKVFVKNRERLAGMMAKNALAIVHTNDVMPTNADGTLGYAPSNDLYYLAGIEQEESILLVFPDSFDEKYREVLFIRPHSELLTIWEGHKLSKDEARKRSGVQTVLWTTDFPKVLHMLMCECEQVYLNSNEHKRCSSEVETREMRFAAECQRKYPLHTYQRLARLMHALRVVKAPAEIEQIRKACAITKKGFHRVCRFVKPGVKEFEVEAEFAHEFIRNGGSFSYPPILCSGKNNCVLHYNSNDQVCKKGELLLMDVASTYGRYNSDLTRTIPVSGKFTRRQRQVYNAVLRVFRGAADMMRPGVLQREIQKAAEQMVEKELVDLGLLKMSDIRKQNPEQPALKKYFMHGLGHPIGLDVHDVGFGSTPLAAGWVMTCEPGIYVPEEGFGVRLENDILVTDGAPVDLMSDIPIEADEIEALMSR